MKPTVLITGFEPFGGDLTNPSAEIVEALTGRVVAGRTIQGITLPVVFGASRRRLAAAIKRYDPELVICLGLAASRRAISLERVAINVDDARIPDNAGQQPVDRPILVRGPAAYWTSLPIKAIAAELTAQGVPAEVSQTAGTYVCNHVFYGLMDGLRRRSATRGGFIHVPVPQADGLTLAGMERAIESVIATTLATPTDIARPGGAVD